MVSWPEADHAAETWVPRYCSTAWEGISAVDLDQLSPRHREEEPESSEVGSRLEPGALAPRRRWSARNARTRGRRHTMDLASSRRRSHQLVYGALHRCRGQR